MGNLRWANTEPSMHFRKTNMDPSVHFRKANTDPFVHFRKANKEFLLCPREIPRSSPASPWKTLSIPPLLLGYTQ